MHTLIISAHPSKQSFTYAIVGAYEAFCKNHHQTVEHINLYDPAWKLDFLTYEDPAEMRDLSPLQLAWQEKIRGVDELVLVFPTWWVNMPAILKNFFDQVFTPGFAYKYVSGKYFPQKFLTGKTAKIFTTCDAYGWMYWLIGHPLRVILQIGTLGWCGIRTKKFRIIDRLRKRTPLERLQILESIESGG